VYVQQQPVLLTSSVGAELMLPSTLYPELQPAAQAYSTLFNLQDVSGHDVHSLSGGERQRLVLARQFSFAPSLLLLDECTSNLGWLHVQTIERELIRMKEGGACIVMVTHNIPQAHRMADVIVVLREGERLQEDDPFAVSLLKGEWFDHE
jgi:ABC-type phosphate transport system ATPase subunit